MKIKLSEIGPEGQELDLLMDEAWMARQLKDVASAERAGRGRAALKAHLVGTTLNVSGRIQADFYVPCSRCLEPAKMEMDSPVRFVFAKRPQGYKFAEELELEADDLDFAYYDEDEIDLEPLLREQLILEVPIAPLCSDACAPEWQTADLSGGDRAGAGAGGGSVDPRWAPLVKLKKEQKGREE